ncbi:nuclear transport factor 2 family protein [Maricaulaceae bacterium MS644]
MTNTVPFAVARYFAARSPEAIADCFTEDGIAVDEGRTHRGRAQIRNWRAEADRISYRLDILSVESENGRTTVHCRITGDFKGSTARLEFRFDLSGDLVAKLEIV